MPGLNRPVNAMCEVRWVRDYNVDCPDMVPGAGMKFVNLDAEARAAIELFIRHREPIFFDED